MSEGEESATGTSAAPPETPTPRPKNVGRFKPGQSGNPNGRPKIEPRVRRYARRYDFAMCKTLAALAQDPKVPPGERRRAAMDLISVGSGRPALVQEIANKGAPLFGVGVNIGIGGAAMGSGPGGGLSPEQAYRLMCEGIIEATGDHPAFKPPIEHEPKGEPK
jgi:hypothetical protein